MSDGASGDRTRTPAQAFQPRLAAVGLAALVLADIGVLFLFSRHLVTKLVLKPMEQLAAAADAVVDGNLEARAGNAGTLEFDFLAERLNEMTDYLLGAQNEVIRSEKLASVGRLAAGIAHEVGNPVTAINTYVELMRMRGVNSEVLGDIERETERIDRIIKGLLAYARPKREEAAFVDLAAILENVMELLGAQGTLRKVDLHLRLSDGLPPVLGQSHTLEHVFVNLILNAVDAAPGGTITVGVAQHTYLADSSRVLREGDRESLVVQRRAPGARPKRPEIPAGTPGLVAWVSDSGPGVPPEDRERIFDPFFTTKEPGKGTGLGLAIVQRTVYEMGGLVWVDDAREGGASFKVFLPEAL